MKNQALPDVILHIKNLESTEFINKKQGKLILHSLLANRMLDYFALVVLDWIKAYSHDVSCII